MKATIIDSEPVKEREYWRISYERYVAVNGDMRWERCIDIARDTKNAAVEAFLRRHNDRLDLVRGVVIGSVRETVLSREEITRETNG